MNSVAIRPRGSGTAIIGSSALNPIAWWDVLGQQFPSIRQWAFDTLACQQHPASASEPLAVQNELVTPDRNALGDDLF